MSMKQRRRKPDTTEAASPVSSLLSPQGMGGISGSRGYSVQLAYALVHLPLWLKDPAFASFMVEAAGDVDVKFCSAGDTWRQYTQVKDRYVTDRLFQEVLHQFVEKQKLLGAYRHFTLVAKSFNRGVASLIEGVARLRNAEGFFAIQGAEILNATRCDLRKRAARCHLDDEELSFILEHVFFAEIPGLSDPANARSHFKGRLGDSYSTFTGQMLDSVYQAVYELVGTSTGREITRTDVESLIQKVAVPNQGGQANHSSPISLMQSVRHGTAGDIDAPFAAMHSALDSDPYWRFGINLLADGRRSISITPRFPEAAKYAPLRLRVAPHSPTTGGFAELSRKLYEGGDPLSLPATVELRLGDRVLIPQSNSRVKLGIPEDAVRDLTMVIRVIPNTKDVLEYYLPMQFRGFQGTAFGDNRKQADAPIHVNITATRDSTVTDTARMSMTCGITRAGQTRARQRLKFLRFTQTLGVYRKSVSVYIVHGGELVPVTTSPVTIPDVNANRITQEIHFWERVVALEDRLGTVFSLPENLAEEECRTLEFLWQLLCTGRVEYTVDDKFSVNLDDEISAVEAKSLVDAVGPIHLTGLQGPDTIELFGTTIVIPQREMSVSPVWVADRDALHLQVSEGKTVRPQFITGDSVTITEELHSPHS